MGMLLLIIQQEGSVFNGKLPLANQDDGCHAHCSRKISGRIHVRLLFPTVGLLFKLELFTCSLWNYNHTNTDLVGDD